MPRPVSVRSGRVEFLKLKSRKEGMARHLPMVAGFKLAAVRRSHCRYLYRHQPHLRRVLRPRWRMHCGNDARLLPRGVLFQCANARHGWLRPLVSTKCLRPRRYDRRNHQWHVRARSHDWLDLCSLLPARRPNSIQQINCHRTTQWPTYSDVARR